MSEIDFFKKKSAYDLIFQKWIMNPPEDVLNRSIVERLDLVSRIVYGMPRADVLGHEAWRDNAWSIAISSEFWESAFGARKNLDVYLSIPLRRDHHDPFQGRNANLVEAIFPRGQVLNGDLLLPLWMCEGRRVRVPENCAMTLAPNRWWFCSNWNGRPLPVSEKSLPFVDFIGTNGPWEVVMLDTDEERGEESGPLWGNGVWEPLAREPEDVERLGRPAR